MRTGGIIRRSCRAGIMKATRKKRRPNERLRWLFWSWRGGEGTVSFQEIQWSIEYAMAFSLVRDDWIECAELFVKGKSLIEIGRKLRVCPQTVRLRIRKMVNKCRYHRRYPLE